MKNTVLLLSLVLLPVAANAQGWLGRTEGSRPGQTYGGGQQQQQNPQYQQQPQYQGQQQQAEPARQVQSSSGGQPMILEFSDLQCPDSARYNRGLKQDIMRRYVTSGRVGYEWHDFPLPSHSQAPEAAAAARCAGNSADRMRQQIMSNQGSMSASTYAGYARQMGVNTTQFSSCLRGGSSMQSVQSDHSLGESYGVRGTPSLVLGVKESNGFRPVKVVKAYDPPQQVMAEIDNFLASAGGTRQQHTR